MTTRRLGVAIALLLVGCAATKKTTDPNQANGNSYGPALSGDGAVVAFASDASNLVPDDENGVADVFVRDRKANRIERASVPSGGGESNGASFGASASGDGRAVAFLSDASNLVAGDENGVTDVFVRDRSAGTTRRVSVGTGGAESDGVAADAAISPDGRWVAFSSYATNLGGSDGDGSETNVFLHDLQTGTTSLLSGAPADRPGDGWSAEAATVPGAKLVAFSTSSRNLSTELEVPDDEWFEQIVLVEPGSPDVRVVSAAGGRLGNGNSRGPEVSADGSSVVFHSLATDLVGGPGGSWWEVFVADRRTGKIEWITSKGRDGTSSEPDLSADGRVVSFLSSAQGLVDAEVPDSFQVYAHDRSVGTTDVVSVSSTGQAANGESEGPVPISDDGRFVAFSSWATNLVPNDTNRSQDVFLRDRVTGTTERISVP